MKWGLSLRRKAAELFESGLGYKLNQESIVKQCVTGHILGEHQALKVFVLQKTIIQIIHLNLNQLSWLIA